MSEEYQTANRVADFNETDFKKFASRVGDRWSFTLPSHEMQNLDSLLPNHVLTIEDVTMGPGAAIMVGKLVRKKEQANG